MTMTTMPMTPKTITTRTIAIGSFRLTPNEPKSIQRATQATQQAIRNLNNYLYLKAKPDVDNISMVDLGEALQKYYAETRTH